MDEFMCQFEKIIKTKKKGMKTDFLDETLRFWVLNDQYKYSQE